MRLDRFIASNSEHSRSDVQKLIKSGRITVNKRPATHTSVHVEEQDIVCVDGSLVSDIGKLYIMMHKPPGFVCATKDSLHPTVIDLLRDQQRFIGEEKVYETIKLCLEKGDMQIVGRLDVDTTGLLLLTNDGQWNHKITSPNSRCTKTYVASLAEPIDKDTQNTFAAGVYLKHEDTFTEPSPLQIIENNMVRLSLHEGKYHQVKRMFGACNNRVISLHREQIGKLTLDSRLAEGNFRLLSSNETV